VWFGLAGGVRAVQVGVVAVGCQAGVQVPDWWVSRRLSSRCWLGPVIRMRCHLSFLVVPV